jgi:two-component system LytT family response regulator
VGGRAVTPRIRTLIADDEPAARDAIRSLLADDADIDIVGDCADGRSALETVRASRPDLMFLDVQMPGMDGISVLRALDPAELPVVVFITAHDRYAVNAFEVHAVDYLLKPFDDRRFHQALAIAKERVRQGRIGALRQELIDLLGAPAEAPAAALDGGYLKRLVIKSGGRVTLLGVADIDWIEADGDYVKVHAGRAWHLLRETMKHIEGQFDPAQFVRIHRSTIVNVERIKELQPYFKGEYVVKLHDGTSLKLSRGFRPHLEKALGRTF